MVYVSLVHSGPMPRRRARRADTNVLAVKFNTLTGPSHVHTGDSVVCSNPTCTAILSHLSQLSESKEQDGDTQVHCRYCSRIHAIYMYLYYTLHVWHVHSLILYVHCTCTFIHMRSWYKSIKEVCIKTARKFRDSINGMYMYM